MATRISSGSSRDLASQVVGPRAFGTAVEGSVGTLCPSDITGNIRWDAVGQL